MRPDKTIKTNRDGLRAAKLTRIENATDRLLDAYREMRQAIEGRSDYRHLEALARDCKLFERELEAAILGGES